MFGLIKSASDLIANYLMAISHNYLYVDISLLFPESKGFDMTINSEKKPRIRGSDYGSDYEEKKGALSDGEAHPK